MINLLLKIEKEPTVTIVKYMIKNITLHWTWGDNKQGRRMQWIDETGVTD